MKCRKELEAKKQEIYNLHQTEPPLALTNMTFGVIPMRNKLNMSNSLVKPTCKLFSIKKTNKRTKNGKNKIVL